MKTKHAFMIVVVIFSVGCPFLSAAEPATVVKAKPFPLSRVMLLDSPFKKAMEINRAYLLKLDADRFLWPFHERAGMKPTGERYGGWEMKDVVGHTSGHYISACALTYAATGDKELKKRVDYMVSEIARAQAKHGNGYAGSVRTEVWKEAFSDKFRVHKWGLAGGYVPWYVLHKTYAGLMDAYTHAGNKQALEVARKFGDWAKKGTDVLSDELFQKSLRAEYGGMNDSMARLHSLTDNKDFLTLARRFNHKQIFDPLAAERDELQGKHVNTQLPKIIGAARICDLTGDKRMGTVARFFWDRAVDTRSFAPGGVDFHEHFRAPNAEAKFLNWDSCETCVTYNMLKLTRHVFGWKPVAKYMDYYERALYNHILGSQDPKSGGVTYFYSLRPGHFKIYSKDFDSMWCCVGTGIENHSRYGETIYYRDAEGLWVNLFIASQLDWKEKGVTVRQETQFPQTDTTTITLSTKKPQKLAIRIRVPYWATGGVEVSINGKSEKVDAKPQSYLVLTRQWKDGDKIKVRLPMSLHLRAARDDKNLGVVMFGPLVLAGELGTEGVPKNLNCGHNKQYSGDPVPAVPAFVIASRDPSAWVKRTDAKAMKFKTRNVGKPNDVSLLPLHEMHHQRYTVYWKLFTQAAWAKEQTARQAAAQKLNALEAATIDLVTPGSPLERAHNQKGKGSGSGSAFGGKWRDARGGGWFSYDMKVPPDQPVCAIVKYWGGDSGGRVFDILIDDKKIATYNLNAPKPGEFIDVTYAIPAETTKGKKKVTIKFQAHPGRTAGGIFACRIIKIQK